MEEPLVQPKKKPRSQLGCFSCLERIPFLGDNPIPYLQLILYGNIAFFGLLTCIPLGVVLTRFDRSCILYAQVVWDDKTIWPWAEPACDFEIYMNLAVNVVFATLMGLFIFVFMAPRYDEDYVRQKRIRYLGRMMKYQRNYVLIAMNPIITVVHCVCWATQLSGSIVLAVGLARTCDWLEKTLPGGMSCAKASTKLDWSEYTIIRDEDDNGVQGRGFYGALVFATITSFLLVILWTLQLVLNFGQICNRCSCEIAEEKVKMKTSAIIASRRSRLATPIGTPGGRHTPVPVGQPMAPFRPLGVGPPPAQSQFSGGSMSLQQPGFNQSSEA